MHTIWMTTGEVGTRTWDLRLPLGVGVNDQHRGPCNPCSSSHRTNLRQKKWRVNMCVRELCQVHLLRGQRQQLNADVLCFL